MARPAAESVSSSRRAQKLKVSEEIIESLRRDIIIGRLPQGSRLPSERKLAESFGVSQPTMREALRALEILGLVEVRHGSGTYIGTRAKSALASALLTVMQLEDVGVIEVQSVRRILGIESIVLAATSATTAQIQAMEAAVDALDRLDEAPTLEEELKVLLSFQTALSAASNSPLIYSLEMFLSTLLLELQAGLFRTKGREYWRERFSAPQTERKAVLAAIRSGSPQESRKAAETFFKHSGEIFDSDPVLRAAKLSDETLAEPISEIVKRLRSA
jgi:GntR family transcriptional repressor for pyruvate dehydrogenase complex